MRRALDVTSLEQRAHAMFDAASIVERAAEDVTELARDHDAGELLRIARVIGGTARAVVRVRNRIVAGTQLRPARDLGGDRPSFADIADALGDRTSTVYGRHVRALREGIETPPTDDGPVPSALASLIGTPSEPWLPATEVTDERLVEAAQASWERRRCNSADGAAVLAALAARIGWDEVANRTGIPVDVARAWGTPPPGTSTGEAS